MPTKLKIILGILLIVAAFLVIRVGSSFYRSAKTAALISQTVTTPAPEENFLTKDSDGDGLPDRDEIIYATDPYNKDTDGDGYRDGEEVMSGHDPLDSSGNDEIEGSLAFGNANSLNITQRAAGLALATIIGDDGQIDKSRISDENLDNVTQTTLQEAALSFSVSKISDSDIKIMEDDSPETIKKYINSIGPIIEENIISPNTVGHGITSITATGLSKDYPEFYRKAYESLKIIEVPPSWKELHKSGLILLLKLSDAFDALTVIDKDPVRAAYAIVMAQDSFLQLGTLLGQVASLAKSQNINTQDTILETLKLGDFLK